MELPFKAGMRVSATGFFLAVAALVFVLGSPEPSWAQEYEDLKDCLVSDTREGAEKGGPEWWSRRSEEEKRYLRELPCEEKYLATVCIFLFDPNLKECVNRSVGDRRANHYCSEQGHAILSPEMAQCEKNYLATTYKPPF